MKIFNVFITCFILSLQILQVTDNPLWLRYPAISPDGSQIAFCYIDKGACSLA